MFINIDLCGDTFAAGRDATNNLTLTSGELHENVLLRISKVHFVIRKDLEDKTGPVYIEVIREYKKNHLDITNLLQNATKKSSNLF